MAKSNIKKRKIEPKISLPRKDMVKKFLPLAAILVLILAVYLFFKNSSYFKLDRIELVDISGALDVERRDLLKIYKGRNIFGIDINSLSSRIKNDYPVIKDAIVKRILPNRLEIDIIPRIPIARVKTREYFPVDRTGMVLSPGIKSGKLPVIIGFRIWMMPKAGERIKNRQLESAFLLIDALKESSVSLNYDVTMIDVSNYKNISFYLEDEIEVKIGGEGFANRLKVLKSALENPKLDKENIKYIDLRFKDVVIGPK